MQLSQGFNKRKGLELLLEYKHQVLFYQWAGFLD